MDSQKIDLYGNEKLLNFFKNAYEAGKISHAYIFEGGRGSGKRTLARRLACLLACENMFERPCFACESCRKVAAGISPDVIETETPKDKKNIGVEQIRELRSSVYIKPNELDIKVYIIRNAETMTVQAQNVFLKVLEEPPAGVYFFLLCENTANILPTVKSRAPVLKTQIFTDKELSDYLIKYNAAARALYESNPDELSLVVRIAEGKIGEAERLISDSKSNAGQSRREKAGKLIELAGDDGNGGDVLTFAQKMASTRDEASDILLYAAYAARDLAAVKRADADKISLLFYNEGDYALKVASKFTAAGVIKIYDELCRAREQLLLNVNLNNSLVYLAYELRKAAAI